MNKSPGPGRRIGRGFRTPRAGGPVPADREGPADTADAADTAEEAAASPPVLLSLLSRASLVVFLLCFLCVFLYALGLWRGFTGSSLLAFVQTAVYGGIVLAILSLYRFVAGFWFFLRRRRPMFLLGGLGFLLLGGLGALLAAAGTFIAALAEGNI